MQHFIVIGNPINHSKSPQIHQAFAQELDIKIRYQRQLCPNDPQSFMAVVEAFFAGGGTGANVTLPFKEMAYQLCKNQGQLSLDAQKAKAVNTLCYKQGELYGDNTDGRGLVTDLIAQQVPLNGATVAIIGAGGATRGAILPLLQAGAKISVFNRTLSKAQDLVADFDQAITVYALAELLDTPFSFDVVINATSATTTNQTLNLGKLQTKAAYDMMYGKPSDFLEHFAQQGAKTLDGFGMLIHQAALSFELWTGQKADPSKVRL